VVFSRVPFFYDGEKSMSQIDKIARVLTKNSKYPGMTASMVAKFANVPRSNVAKRVHDLRNEGYSIYTNYRLVRGKRKAYYRLAV
jgi:DNA-binding Lrp family transcriptional regulator